MNMSALRRVLDPACRIYTVCVLLLCAFQMLFATEEQVIFPLSFFLLFPFACCFAGANLLMRADKISAGLRMLGHFLLFTAGIVLFVFLPAGVFSNGSSALVMVAVYLLLYWVTMAVIAALRHQLKRAQAQAKSTYRSQYENLRERR